jgi:dihydrofolate synthase/folylpolyglutamate synthase
MLNKMNYQETTDWMFNQLPMYQFQGASAYKKDLTNTHLLDHLSNPHKKVKCVHVAGTNGKGSTSHMLASILQEASRLVYVSTSKRFQERIKINGADITKLRL